MQFSGEWDIGEYAISLLVNKNEIEPYKAEIDNILFSGFGSSYNWSLQKTFDGYGQNSSALVIHDKDEMVGCLVFKEEPDHDRVETGRLVISPDADLNFTRLRKPLRHLIRTMEYAIDPAVLNWSKTRFWFSGLQAEMYDMKLFGHKIMDKKMKTPWSSFGHIYYGIYIRIQEERLKNTYKIPDEVISHLRAWKPMFEVYNGRYEAYSDYVDYNIEEFEKNTKLTDESTPGSTDGSIPGYICYYPLSSHPDNIDALSRLIQQGFVMTTYLPSWNKIDDTYIPYAILQKKTDCFDDYPCHSIRKNTGCNRYYLTEEEMVFNQNYLADCNGNHLFYQQPLQKLFKSRKTGITTKTIMKINELMGYRFTI